MSARTVQATVTFARPFRLGGMDREQSAGTYTVETDEVLLEGLSFPAYRRTATWILLPKSAFKATSAEVVNIDPLELDAALKRDGVVEPTVNELRAREILQHAVRAVQPTPSQREEQSRNLAALMRGSQPG